MSRLFWKRRSQRNSELDEEIRTHLTLAEREARESTASVASSPQNSVSAAHREFGNAALAAELTRDQWPARRLFEFFQDSRYALRMLRKNPGFTAVAVLTLALGIGANTAVFSVVNSVLLKPLPYRDEQRLVMIWETNLRLTTDHNVLGPSNFRFWQTNNTVFDGMSAFFDDSSTLTGQGEPEKVPTQYISANFFSLLGVSPILGRDFTPDEGVHGHNQVALLSYGLWREKFGGARDVIGKKILLDGDPTLVVGVMPPGAQLFVPKGSLTGESPEMWVPIGWSDATLKPRGRYMSAIARLKPGVTLAGAQTQMDALVAEITRQYPDFETGWGVKLVPVHQDLTANVSTALWVLLAGVALVLLIACANVASLLLSHAAAREKELAVRAALGAGRARIVRQSLAECLVLAAIGGAIGVVIAFWGTKILFSLAPKDLLQVPAGKLDLFVLAFSAAISLLTALIFGVAPALDAGRVHLTESLREGGRSLTGARTRKLQGAFVVAEIALSLVLLAGAGLMLRSFSRLTSLNPGFNSANVLIARVNLPSTSYKTDAQYMNFFQQLLERVRALPGVRSATITNSMPLTGMTPGTDYTIVGQPAPPPGQEKNTQVQFVDHAYFSMLGIPLLRGRDFSDREEAAASHVVIVNEAFARAAFPHENPIGKKVMIDMGVKDPSEIIGIVGDVRRESLDKTPIALAYWPHAELPFSSMVIAIHTAGDPLQFVSALRAVVQGMDANLPLANVATMDQWMGDSVSRQRFSALLLGVFAAIALALAAVGIYGVVAYTTQQRTREFGIRMALGAGRANVLWLVLRQGSRLAFAGVAIGLAGAIAAVQFLRTMLFELSPYDPLTLAAASAFLAAVALIACWIPARRATVVDPILALRHE